MPGGQIGLERQIPRLGFIAETLTIWKIDTNSDPRSEQRIEVLAEPKNEMVNIGTGGMCILLPYSPTNGGPDLSEKGPVRLEFRPSTSGGRVTMSLRLPQTYVVPLAYVRWTKDLDQAGRKVRLVGIEFDQKTLPPEVLTWVRVLDCRAPEDEEKKTGATKEEVKAAFYLGLNVIGVVCGMWALVFPTGGVQDYILLTLMISTTLIYGLRHMVSSLFEWKNAR